MPLNVDMDDQHGIDGIWHGWFMSRFSGKPHHMILDLNLDGEAPSASLSLARAEPDPVNHETEYQFDVRVETAGHRDNHFVALLAKDQAALGLITMVLKVKDGSLRGHLVFNNVRTQEVDHGQIEWNRDSSPPGPGPQG